MRSANSLKIRKDTSEHKRISAHAGIARRRRADLSLHLELLNYIPPIFHPRPILLSCPNRQIYRHQPWSAISFGSLKEGVVGARGAGVAGGLRRAAAAVADLADAPSAESLLVELFAEPILLTYMFTSSFFSRAFRESTPACANASRKSATLIFCAAIRFSAAIAAFAAPLDMVNCSPPS